jgi:hypothetical protein
MQTQTLAITHTNAKGAKTKADEANHGDTLAALGIDVRDEEYEGKQQWVFEAVALAKDSVIIFADDEDKDAEDYKSAMDKFTDWVVDRMEKLEFIGYDQRMLLPGEDQAYFSGVLCGKMEKLIPTSSVLVAKPRKKAAAKTVTKTAINPVAEALARRAKEE